MPGHAQRDRRDAARAPGKRMIDATALSPLEVSFVAAFRSVRRFNDAFRVSYRRPPSAFRRGAAKSSALPIRGPEEQTGCQDRLPGYASSM